MMNSQFSSYVTKTAFNLTLSKNQVLVLCLQTLSNRNEILENIVSMGYDFRTLSSLRNRGLIEWKGEYKNTHGPYLTSAGNITIELIREAGLFPAELIDAAQTKQVK